MKLDVGGRPQWTVGDSHSECGEMNERMNLLTESGSESENLQSAKWTTAVTLLLKS